MDLVSVPHLKRPRVRGQNRLRVRERSLLLMSTLILAELCMKGQQQCRVGA